MSKYSFLIVLFGVMTTSCKNQLSTEEHTKPNIVFILVDDLGIMDLSFAGSQFYDSPNIDKLASQGMVFTQGYAASRVCSPSRASIMTGKFTARHGITDWIGAKSGTEWRTHNRHDKLLPAKYEHRLSERDTTLAEALLNAGYNTFFAGKWHLGSEGSYPGQHGFEINRGGWEKGSPIGGYFSPWENPSLPNLENGENLSMRLAKETSEFIRRQKDSTFFAFLSFYAVHGPIQTTEQKWQKYRNKAKMKALAKSGYKMERVLPIRQVQDNPIYAGLVESMDDAVGVVLQSLIDNGLENNTIVVFTSDNGGVASGDSFSTSNLPFRGGKGYQWEGGIREPYIIKVPWLSHGRKTSSYPVTGTDFYPTLLDFAGLELMPYQHQDGLSLRPLLEGEEMSIERPLYWHYPHYGNQGGNPSSILQEQGWKLIHYWEDGNDELYNLVADPGEQLDVASQHPERTREMAGKLLKWLASVGANMPESDPEYDMLLAKERHDNIITQKLPALERERLEVLADGFVPNEDWWGSKITKE